MMMAPELVATNGYRMSVQRSASNAVSPQPSLSVMADEPDAYINLQIFVPELQIQVGRTLLQTFDCLIKISYLSARSKEMPTRVIYLNGTQIIYW